jgi:hypothetical protein
MAVSHWPEYFTAGRDAHGRLQGGRTTAGMQEVEQRREQLPRQSNAGSGCRGRSRREQAIERTQKDLISHGFPVAVEVDAASQFIPGSATILNLVRINGRARQGLVRRRLLQVSTC